MKIKTNGWGSHASATSAKLGKEDIKFSVGFIGEMRDGAES